MVEFLCPKLFSVFTILLNAFEAVFLGSVTCYISTVFFIVNVIIFCVKSDVKLAFILNSIAFGLTVLFLGYNYLFAIFSSYVYVKKEEYEKTPYPTSFFDDLNFKFRMLSIGLYTLLFVTNFTNMWVYKVNYDKKQTAIPIPNQPILG